jgi:hypothetical protein
VAVLADLPVTYAGDSQSFEFDPRLRWAKTHGDLALLSDYQYLDGIWKFTSERTSLLASAAWHRDSTLYTPFENAALFGRNLRRLEYTANLAWQWAASERSDLQLVSAWDQVSYSQNSSSGLDNFRYGQAALEYERALTERWQWTSSIGFGRYELRNQSYRSDNRFAQTALTRALSELWSLNANVGYSNLNANQTSLVCCEIVPGPGGDQLQLIPVKNTSSRGTASYALSLERKALRWTLDIAASRAIQPSGLGALLTQDDASVKASLAATERLTLGALLHAARQSDSLRRLSLGDQRYYDADLNAVWLWTEHWTLGLQTAYIRQRYAGGASTASGVTVYLNLSRQFGRLRLGR